MIQQSKMDRIKELVELLNKAGKSYYSEGSHCPFCGVISYADE